MSLAIPFSRPELTTATLTEVLAVLQSGWLTTGPRVAEFEQAFSSYLGVGAALALNSCTAALHLALRGCGVGAGDEVIVPALTYCATAHAAVHCGAIPVVVDVEDGSCVMSVQGLTEKITPRTRAIVVVHFGGLPAPIAEICALAECYGIAVVEDCAHAIETEVNGRHVGTFGNFGVFSFYATKNLTTGEGGALVARDPDHLTAARLLSLHGVSKRAWDRAEGRSYRHYDVVAPGFKYNMMDVQAALGIHQLAAVEQNWIRRHAIWGEYKARLARLPLLLPADAPADARHAHHLFPVQISDEAVALGFTRDGLLDGLGRLGIGTGVHYHALSEFSYFQKTFGWTPDDTPVSTKIGRRTFSLPLNPYLSDTDIDAVCKAVEKLFG